jgi:hypothetical protein
MTFIGVPRPVLMVEQISDWALGQRIAPHQRDSWLMAAGDVTLGQRSLSQDLR